MDWKPNWEELRMSFEKIEHDMRQLEAVKYYPSVKKERDDALKKAKELERTASALREKLEALEKQLKEEAARMASNEFNMMKTAWIETEKPKEVLSEAIKQLANVIEMFHKAGFKLNLQVPDANMPTKVKEILDCEVNERLKAEFDRRVQDESDKKVKEKLNQLINAEWPKWLNTTVEPKIKALESRIETNAFSLLRGPWAIICDKCHEEQSIDFTPENIRELLLSGYTQVECQDPKCMDQPFLARATKHKIKLSLTDLIRSLIPKPPENPPLQGWVAIPYVGNNQFGVNSFEANYNK